MSRGKRNIAASQALADPSVPFFAKFAAVAKVFGDRSWSGKLHPQPELIRTVFRWRYVRIA